MLLLPRPHRQRRDGGGQLVRIDRLGDVHLESRQQRSPAILRARERRQRDGGNIFRGEALADFADERGSGKQIYH